MRFWDLPTVAVFWLLLTIFLARFFMLNQAIYGDGIYYWAYIRSAVIDHDLDLRNEASHSYSPEGNNSLFNPAQYDSSLVANKFYPVGPSFMWSPAFVLAHLLSKPLSLPANGFADHYQVAVGILNISFVVIGLVLLFRLLLYRYTMFIAYLTVALTLFATNLLYYGSIDILNSHPSSFFISCVLLTLLFKLNQKYTSGRLFFSGLTLGLLGLIRPQDALFGVLFLPFLVSKNLTTSLKRSLLFICAASIAYIPQLITSLTIFGSMFALPYLTSTETFYPAQPHLLELFFTPSQGLVYYSPIYLVGIVGLFLYAKERKPFGSVFLLVLFLELFLISIWSGWSQGEAFGLRMMISLLPVLGFGIAEVFTKLSNKLSRFAIIMIVLLYVFQNVFMIVAFHLFLHEPTYINGELTPGGKMRENILEKIDSSYFPRFDVK